MVNSLPFPVWTLVNPASVVASSLPLCFAVSKRLVLSGSFGICKSTLFHCGLSRKFLPTFSMKRSKKSLLWQLQNIFLRFPASSLKCRVHWAGPLFLWWLPGVSIIEELIMQKLTVQGNWNKATILYWIKSHTGLGSSCPEKSCAGTWRSR